MSVLLIRSALRRRVHQLPYLLSTQFRSVSIANIQFNREKHIKNDTSIVTSTGNHRTDVSTDVRPIGERIKENTKTVSYLSVIVLGITVTGIMFFAIFRELLSSTSPNNVYSAALETCINDPRVQDTLGAPIKGFGEETRRRRRTHVAHTVYERNGAPHMRMQFYIQGIRNKATVHLEKRIVRIYSFIYNVLIM